MLKIQKISFQCQVKFVNAIDKVEVDEKRALSSFKVRKVV